jgi:ankyrin repeat protein
LHHAAQSGNSETVALLIEKGACVNALKTDNKTPLHVAVARGNAEMVALLIEKGVSVNALTTANETPLHKAAERGSVEIVALLIATLCCIRWQFRNSYLTNPERSMC